MKKKGLSIIVGEVILIGIVLALGISYFIWTRTISSTAGSQGAGEITCSSLSLLIGDVCYTENAGLKTVQFSVRNDANIKIWNFSVMIEYNGGAKTFYPLGESEVESSGFKTLTSQAIDSSITPDRVLISPIIKIDSQFFICNDKGLVKIWSELKQC